MFSKAAVSGGCGGEEANLNSSQKCSGCKTVCSIACSICHKYNLVLCAKCYVRGNYRDGVSYTEFRRVEIREPRVTEWTDKETLQRLEAVMQYGDDWKRVAEHVTGRSEKDCVACFMKLPFSKQFVGSPDLSHDESISCQTKGHVDAQCRAEPEPKKMRLSPLVGASKPIISQASCLAGVRVSEAAIKKQEAARVETDISLSSKGLLEKLKKRKTPSIGPEGVAASVEEVGSPVKHHKPSEPTTNPSEDINKLKNLLFPSCAVHLAGKTTQELTSGTAVATFQAFQACLFNHSMMEALEKEVRDLKKDKMRLSSQLETSRKKVDKYRGVTAGLSDELALWKGKAKHYKKQVAEAGTYFALQARIGALEEYSKGEHINWDLEADKKLMADNFKDKPDIAVVSDTEDEN